MPVSVRVFTELPLVINNTDAVLLGRSNLLATAFPTPVDPAKLVFHIVEPPKLGMLSRQVDGGKKMRRIGLGSNFTQKVNLV